MPFFEEYPIFYDWNTVATILDKSSGNMKLVADVRVHSLQSGQRSKTQEGRADALFHQSATNYPIQERDVSLPESTNNTNS